MRQLLLTAVFTVLALVACGRTSADDAGAGGEAGADASGTGGGGEGGATGSGGVGGLGASGGLASDAGAIGDAGFFADAGFVIEGTVSCMPCQHWTTCWPKDSVPRKEPVQSPMSTCPEAWEVDQSDYPVCAGNATISYLFESDGSWCCYDTLFFFCE